MLYILNDYLDKVKTKNLKKYQIFCIKKSGFVGLISNQRWFENRADDIMPK